MSLQSDIFGYTELQYGHFSEGSTIRPRGVGVPLTTHKIDLAANPHTDVTLTLLNSHSPEPKNRPLFFSPCAIEGEIALEAKTAETFKGLYVSVEGTDLKEGYAGAENGQGVIGEPGETPTYFWQTRSANLLQQETSTNATPTPLEGLRTFPFALELPEAYTPNVGSQHKPSLKDKVGALLKPKKDHETEAEGSDNMADEKHPLPPSFLRHDQGKESTHTIVAAYTVSVTLEFSSKLKPDINVHQTIVVLPLKDQEPADEADIGTTGPSKMDAPLDTTAHAEGRKPDITSWA